MARALKQIAHPALTRADRLRLKTLLDAVPAGADEDDPAFVLLLEDWEVRKMPYPALPTVPAYRCHAGSWITAGVGAVLRAIATYVGDTAARSEADRA